MEFKNFEEVYDYIQNDVNVGEKHLIKQTLNRVKEYGLEKRALEIFNSPSELLRYILYGNRFEDKLMAEKLPNNYDYELVKKEWRRRNEYDEEILPSDKFAWVIPEEKFLEMAADVAFTDVLDKEGDDIPPDEYMDKVKEYYHELINMYLNDEALHDDWYIMRFAYRVWYISIPDIPWELK